MEMNYVVYLGLNLSSFIMIVSLLILSIATSDLKKRVNFYFFLTVLFVFIGMICDAFIGLMFGKTGLFIDIAIRVLDCFSYCTSGIQIITFSCYIYEYLKLKTTVSKKYFNLMILIGVSNIIMAIIASFTNLYAYFDATNYYVQQNTFWISEILPIIFMCVTFYVTLQYKHVLKKREWISLLLYTVFPFFFYGIEILIPNVYLAPTGATFTLFLIFINIQIELRDQIKTHELEMMEMKISIMLGQIQPHFLFNVLNTIDALIFVDPNMAHEAVLDFSNYLRGNLDSLSQRKPIPFSKEMEHTEQYLRLEKIRFKNRLEIIYDLKSVDFMIPAMTLQPIVENAVRHGVTKKRNGGTVEIHTDETDDRYRIMVIDNGIGFDVDNKYQEDRSHIGLSNVKSRVSMQCQGNVFVESTLEVGTKVTIEIPKQKVDRA